MKNYEIDFLGSGTVGERGQIVIPSAARKKLDVKQGDKFVFFSHGPILHVIKSREMDKIFSHIHKRFEGKILTIKNKLKEGNQNVED